TVANQTTAVGYPANLGSVLAVGASSDFDYRSHYSQYGSTLCFVASSDGAHLRNELQSDNTDLQRNSWRRRHDQNRPGAEIQRVLDGFGQRHRDPQTLSVAG